MARFSLLTSRTARPLRVILLASLLTLPVVAAPGEAWAGDTSTAEALFNEGVNAMKRSDFKGACDAFAGSNDADPSPGAQVNLGLCNEKQGKTATAWGWYRSGAGLAEQRGSRDRAELARKEADRLEPKLRKLVISLKTPAQGVSVVRDGTAVPNVVLGREVPVDPGEHAIEVSAPGKKPYKTSITVAAGPGVDRVEIPTLEEEPQAANAGALGGASGVEPPRSEPTDTGSGQRTVGVVLGVAGIGALIGAGVFGYFTTLEDDDRQRYSDLAKALTDESNSPSTSASRKLALPKLIEQANATAEQNKKAAEDNQLVAIICGVSGVVLIGTGVALYVTAGPKGEKKKASLPLVMPWATATSGGVGMTLKF